VKTVYSCGERTGKSALAATAKLKEPNVNDRKFEEVVKDAQQDNLHPDVHSMPVHDVDGSRHFS